MPEGALLKAALARPGAAKGRASGGTGRGLPAPVEVPARETPRAMRGLRVSVGRETTMRLKRRRSEVGEGDGVQNGTPTVDLPDKFGKLKMCALNLLQGKLKKNAIEKLQKTNSTSKTCSQLSNCMPRVWCFYGTLPGNAAANGGARYGRPGPPKEAGLGLGGSNHDGM